MAKRCSRPRLLSLRRSTMPDTIPFHFNRSDGEAQWPEPFRRCGL